MCSDTCVPAGERCAAGFPEMASASLVNWDGWWIMLEVRKGQTESSLFILKNLSGNKYSCQDLRSSIGFFF